jgi:DNA invertase Pin-like site-specific DNA recombinase
MMAAGLAREFDILYVMDLTRLARSQANLAKAIDRLTAKGVRVLTVQNGYDSARKGHKLQVGLEGIIGEAFRETISEKTAAALESRAKAGRATGGRCFGYTSRNELAEAEAPIVTEIFERFAAGESMRAIAKDLNARRVPTPRGRPWYVSAIHALLHNERYLVWNRTAWRKDPDTGKRLCVERDATEHVVAIREDLRLVSDETWQRVRARDTPATYGSRNARPKYPLSGCSCALYREHGREMCGNDMGGNDMGGNDMGVSRLVAEELLIEPFRERLLDDQILLNAVSALKNSEPKNRSLVLEPNGARPNAISGSVLMAPAVSRMVGYRQPGQSARSICVGSGGLICLFPTSHRLSLAR